MNQSELSLLAKRLAAHLDCTQDRVCQQIIRLLAETRQPLTLTHLGKHLHMSLQQVANYLAHIPDTEFDNEGNIVGWGITLVPTRHQFMFSGRTLFTWCAFDTVLFPPLLALCARVQSTCATTDQPISFQVGSEGIENLLPATAVVSLILPAGRIGCIRGTFCQQSLFFRSEEAASPWMSSHPDAILLSIKEAASLGQLTARPLAV